LYVQKRFDITLVLLGLRNTVSLNAYRSDSQALSNLSFGTDIFNQSSRFRQTGYSVNWSHKLGPRTSANVGAQKIHNQAVVGAGDTRQRILTASINRQIQKNLSGAVSYRNTRQDADSGATPGFFSGNYRENAVIGSLLLTF
ncbi:MAG: hypothetical protein ACR2GP_10385, partial [Burkholderiaceae bacterium]